MDQTRTQGPSDSLSGRAQGPSGSLSGQAQGPYREVLDWLVDQIDRLDAHRVQLAAEAERGEVEPTDYATRQVAIEQAHDWLAEQLRQALVARGMQLAA